jgi:IS30 family transposase
MYKHLSLEEREKLFAWNQKGISFREIGRRLGRSDATIARETKRNKTLTRGLEKLSGRYLPCRAQQKADKRACIQRSQASWKGPEVYLYVRKKLTEKQWSPETIAGRLSKDHPGLHIVHETIYQAIYKEQNQKFKLWQYLTVKRKRRMKRGGRCVHHDSRIPEAISIDYRPKIIERRKQIGHWETDNVIGKLTDKSALSVTVERKLRLTIMSKLTVKTASEKAKRLFERMIRLPEALRRTITTDNGVENTNHKQISKSLDMSMYFCHAYHSWEKGSVENMNGRIRRYIPKGISMDYIDEQTIRAIEWELNNTPRKCLDWNTPLEALEEILHNTKTTNRCTSR